LQENFEETVESFLTLQTRRGRNVRIEVSDGKRIVSGMASGILNNSQLGRLGRDNRVRSVSRSLSCDIEQYLRRNSRERGDRNNRGIKGMN